MNPTASAATTSSLWRFPVKSMLGERLDEFEITRGGVLGDRAFALIDVETGNVASAKSVKLFPDLFACRAAYVEPPSPEGPLPPVEITLPDGASVLSDASDVDAVLSRALGRSVTLASSAPDKFTTDQYHPDLEHLDPAGYRDTVVEQHLGSSFFAKAGIKSPLPDGSFLDLFPVSVITSSTLDHLRTLTPGSNFDERRFRMNIVLHTRGEGFVENTWLGQKLNFGEDACINIVMPDPRCVMTTLPMEDLPQDTNILRTLAEHNRLPLGPQGKFPCAGVYAVVVKPGKVRIGMSLTVPVRQKVA